MDIGVSLCFLTSIAIFSILRHKNSFRKSLLLPYFTGLILRMNYDLWNSIINYFLHLLFAFIRYNLCFVYISHRKNSNILRQLISHRASFHYIRNTRNHSTYSLLIILCCPVSNTSVHWHPEFLGAHPYWHCVTILLVFLSAPAPVLTLKIMSAKIDF